MSGTNIFSQDIRTDFKSIHKDFTEFSENLYIYNYEVSNYLYQQFTKDFPDQKPDSSNWESADPTGSMTAVYHNHPAYYNYPTVNVSRENALAFCVWLSRQYRLEKKRKYDSVVFRLPTHEEWMLAAYNNLDEKALFPFDKDSRSLTDNKGFVKANYKAIHEACLKEREGKLYNICEEEETIWLYISNPEGTVMIEGAQRDLTAQVNSFPQNKKMCNLAGNVWEITQKGMIGGSFNSTGYYLSRLAEHLPEITLPNPEVGFRIVMEVIKY